MTKNESKDATQRFKRVLEEQISYNMERQIAPSETKIATRLLKRSGELTEVQMQFHSQFPVEPAFTQAVESVLATFAYQSPKHLQKARQDKRRLSELNGEIAKHAERLAKLLERREQLEATSDFTGNSHSCICDVMEGAGRTNGHFRSYLSERLLHLRGQFDSKYWPPLSAFVNELARNAAEADVVPTSPLTEVATAKSRPSKADVVRALSLVLSSRNYGPFSPAFRLSDQAVASLINCALDLPASELVDASYIKGIRQRDRSDQRQLGDA